MKQKVAVLVFSALLPMVNGCEKKAAPEPRAMAFAEMAPAIAEQGQRFIAERHKLEVVTAESELQKSWESVIAFCGKLRCEVISSSITTKTAVLGPSGVISLRVVPDDLAKLLAFAEKAGRLAQHTTEREDKTTQVIDTEARIKNLTAFRDNLRAMLEKRSATVQDLVQIQKQLTDTQAELDSEASQRKILANETEKVFVEISFRVEKTGGRGAFAEIWDALRDSGLVLADSTASLITVIVAVIPWLILIVPAAWLLVKAWRKLRRKRTAAVTADNLQRLEDKG